MSTRKNRIVVDEGISGYIRDMWPNSIESASCVLNGKPQLLPDLSTDHCDYGSWTFTRGDKVLPLTRFKLTSFQPVVYQSDDDGKWYIGLVERSSVIGVRFSRLSKSTNRWGSTSEGLRNATIKVLTAIDHLHRLVLSLDPELLLSVEFEGDLHDIKTTKLKEEHLSTNDTGQIHNIPSFLARTFGIDATTKKMMELVTYLEEIKLRVAPVPVEMRWLSGPEITQAYIEKVGGSSCMTGKENAYLTEMYAINPDVVSLVISLDKRIRTLVWIVRRNGHEIWYPDRGYPYGQTSTDAKLKVSINEEAQRRGIEVRWLRDYGSEIHPDWRKWLEDGTAPVFIMTLPKGRIVPYMDTLAYGALISPTRAIFARTKELLPYHAKYNSYGHKYAAGALGEPVELIVPVIQPRLNGGGYWKTGYRKCKGCNNETVETLTIDDIRSGHNLSSCPPSIQQTLCEACKDKFVKVWSPFGEGQGREALKEKCEWSEKLKAWVDPDDPNTIGYLERRDGQWATKQSMTMPTNPFQVNIKFIKAVEEALRNDPR